MIPLDPGYNIHFFNRDLIFIYSYQENMLSYPKENLIGAHLSTFLNRADYQTVRATMEKVFNFGTPEYVTTSLKDYSFIALLNKFEENILVAHETIDDPWHREEKIQALWAAAENYRQGNRIELW